MIRYTRLAATAVAATVATAAVAVALATPAHAELSPSPSPTRTGSFTRVELDTTHRHLTARFTRAPRGIASWGEDPKTGTIVVNVVAADRAALAQARSAVAEEPAARIAFVSQAPRPLWNVIGGQTIRNSASRCSAGFAARNSAGSRFVITAGHCTNLGGTWSGVGGTLGTVAASSFPTNDFGTIAISSAAAVSTPLVDRYSSGSDVTVGGYANPTVGSAVCRSGSTTGWRCGTVQANNQTVNYGGGQIVSGLTRTNACAEPGDSGGAYVTNPGAGTRVTALGLTSGGSGNCTSGGTTYFQPVGEVLATYSLTLVTG